ncbi:MAG: enhanced intracellular survival protein Eis [Halobacteriaceae archaeon]
MADPEPRLATAEEFPALLDLVDRCFHHPEGGLAARWPHCYDRDRPGRHAVIERDGRVVAHVGCIPDTLVVGDHTIETWGISGVATDPRYRGEGHMSALLGFWLDRMAAAGVPLSKLGGDRTRYGRFGWEAAGRDRRYRVTPRSLAWDGDSSRVRRYDESDLPAVRELYESRRLRMDRDERDYRERLGRRQVQTLLYGEEAYIAFTRGGEEGRVFEAEGSREGVRTLLGHALAAYGLDALVCHRHPDDALAGLFGAPDVSNESTTHPHRMVYVRDLPAVLAAFEGQMARRWDGGDGTVSVGIEGETAARIGYGSGGVSVSEAGDADLVLDRRAATRLLFGDAATVPGYRGHPFLDAVLPLDFYVPRTDTV